MNESPNLSSHNSALKEQIITQMLSDVVEIVLHHSPYSFDGDCNDCVGGWRCIHRGESNADDFFPVDIEGIICVGTRATLHSKPTEAEHQSAHLAAVRIQWAARAMLARKRQVVEHMEGRAVHILDRCGMEVVPLTHVQPDLLETTATAYHVVPLSSPKETIRDAISSPTAWKQRVSDTGCFQMAP